MRNIFKQIIDSLKRAKQEWKQNNRQAGINNLQSSFAIDEKNGRVYIIHNGVAIMSFDSADSTGVVLSSLNQCRNEAKIYQYGYEKNY